MFSESKKYLSVVILAAVMMSCGNKNQQQQPAAPPAVPVTLTEVTSIEASYYDEYPGSVVPLNQIELRPQVTGFVTGVHFQDGARVRKGQLLYTIDAQLYTANYDQAVANLNVQEANLVKHRKMLTAIMSLTKTMPLPSNSLTMQMLPLR